MNNIIDDIKKNISIKETTKHYQSCNCCEIVGKIEISFMRDKHNGTSGTVITLCEEHIKTLKEQLNQEDVYKKCWETLKSIYRSKEDMCVEKVYTENLLEDFDMLELEFGIRED